MARDYIPLATRINEATKKLKEAGYVVINNNDETFAILKERTKIICKSHNDFFNRTEKLINNG